VTLDQLKAELAADPTGVGYAALLAAGNDSAVAGLLNAKANAGYVPARHVVTTLVRRGSWGMVPYAVLHRLLPDGSTCPYAVYSLLAAVQLAAYAPIEPPIRFEVTPLTAGVDAMVSAGLLSADDRADILAGEVRTSRAEVLWGYGVAVSESLVGEARNFGGV
jgi:hypothetical protein